MKSLTAPEELAVFLSLRGNCLKEAVRPMEASDSYAKAAQLAPACNSYRALLANAESSNSSQPTASSISETIQPSETPFHNAFAPPVGRPDPNPLKQMVNQ